MRSVRCDACGMRALIAASQCPHCGHLFELRDSFGELLPLAHCTTCDSEYPLKRGACVWCGTKPEGFRLAPYAWKGAGVLAFLGLAWGARLADRSMSRAPSTSPTTDTGVSVAIAPSVDSEVATQTLVQANDVGDPPDEGATGFVEPAVIPVESSGAVAPTQPTITLPSLSTTASPPPLTTTPPPPTTDAAPSPSTTEPPPPTVSAPPPRTATAPKAPAKAAPSTSARRTPTKVADAAPSRTASKVVPRTRSSPKGSAPTSRRVRWVGAVAHAWIPVRSNADRKARILASIGPDTRVQLGETRGTWVRLRTRGLSGWVERRYF
jgi:hypothetical protein